MARTKMRPVGIASCSSLLLLLLAVASFAATPTAVLPTHAAVMQRVQFNPGNIVANPLGPECPVKNVRFDKTTEFDYTKAIQYRLLLRAQNVSAQCEADAANNLVVCYTDGSFSIKYGCCSKACRAAFQKAIDSGCARELRLAACRDPRGAPLLLAGDVTLKRCLDYTEMNCKEILAAAAQGSIYAGLTPSAGSDTLSATGVSNDPSNEQGPKSQSSSSAVGRGGVRWKVAAAVLSAAVLAARL